MTKKPLFLHGCDESRIDPKTQDLRHNYYLTRNSATNQVWSWDNGDAIVVRQYQRYHVVIRVNTEVTVMKCDSLREAMIRMGLPFEEYEATDWRVKKELQQLGH